MQNEERKMTSVFERFLSVWVFLCIIVGILLGKFTPGVAAYLDGMAIYVNDAPVVFDDPATFARDALAQQRPVIGVGGIYEARCKQEEYWDFRG